MATRKPKIVPAVEEAEATTPAELTDEEQAKLAELRAELDAQFFARLKKAASFDGELVEVKCDLPGYSDVRVWYNTENRYELAVMFAMIPPKLSLEDRARLYSLFIRRVQWPFKTASGDPVPAPDPTDPDTYLSLFQFHNLAIWIRGAGYEQAKKARAGEVSAPSTES